MKTLEDKKLYAKEYYQKYKKRDYVIQKDKNYHKKYYSVPGKREMINERSRKWRKLVKLKCIQEYGGKCVCCGETNIGFLTLDHINNNGAEHRKLTGSRDNMKWAYMNNFPK